MEDSSRVGVSISSHEHQQAYISSIVTDTATHVMNMPVVSLPHSILDGQLIEIDEGANNILSYSSLDDTDDHALNLKDDPTFWCELLRTGVIKGWINEDCVTQAFVRNNAVDIAQQFLVGIDECLHSIKGEIQGGIKSLGLTLDERILNYIELNFSFDLSICRGSSDYFCNESSFRLLHSSGQLSVLEASYINNLPKPISLIGKMVISLLCTIGHKTLVSDLTGEHLDADPLNEICLGLSVKERARLIDSLEREDFNDTAAVLGEKGEELEFYYGSDWCERLLHVISMQQLTSSSLEVEKMLGGGGVTTRIDRVGSYVSALANSTNPITAHPAFKVFSGVVSLLTTMYEETDNACLPVGSDSILCDWSVVSLSMDEDEVFLHEHGNCLMEVGEEASMIIDVANENYLSALKNICLSDHLLCLMVSPFSESDGVIFT